MNYLGQITLLIEIPSPPESNQSNLHPARGISEVKKPGGSGNVEVSPVSPFKFTHEIRVQSPLHPPGSVNFGAGRGEVYLSFSTKTKLNQ